MVTIYNIVTSQSFITPASVYHLIPTCINNVIQPNSRRGFTFVKSVSYKVDVSVDTNFFPFVR